MVGYQNTQVSYILNENVFADTDIVQTPKDRLGFNIAFGIIDAFTYKAPEGIEKTGLLKANYFSVNVEKYDSGEIPIHKCTLEDKKKFYEPNKIYQSSFDFVFTELYCITSPENLVMNGDWNGDVGS
jgi:hypothetical protein